METLFLTSSVLAVAGFRHAFFTRRGGVTPPPFDSLDFGSSTSSPTEIEENLRRAAGALEVDPSRLFMLSQVHGTRIRTIDGVAERAALMAETGDALVAALPSVACAVRTADCVPILIADRERGTVAAVHSGWKGTAANIAGAVVRELARPRADPRALVAAIGPHVERCCFQVGSDVAQLLARASNASRAVESRGDRVFVSLRDVVRAQLEGAGVQTESIDDVAGCTVCDRERFFSHRRDRDRAGRLLSAIVARGGSAPLSAS